MYRATLYILGSWEWVEISYEILPKADILDALKMFFPNDRPIIVKFELLCSIADNYNVKHISTNGRYYVTFELYEENHNWMIEGF